MPASPLMAMHSAFFISSLLFTWSLTYSDMPVLPVSYELTLHH
ncbi:hypothetical protein MY4824_009735 [Beauveria thailandica]